MAHNNLQVRPTKIGIQSVASPMGKTDPTRIVCQRPILVVVGRPLHNRSLIPKAAVRTAVPKWSSRRDSRKCTKKLPSNPSKPSKRKVGRQRWQVHRRRSDKHQNGSRVATPKSSGSRRLLEVHKQVHETLRRELWDDRSASGALRSGYCSEPRRWVYPLGSFFLGAKCMRQPVPRIAARDTITHNHTDDVRVVGITEVPGWGTP